MSTNTSYQTNFSGIKFNNNPLSVDINSFSNANNVYLNKYGALISRPPIEAQDYPWQAYGIDPIPIHLKIVRTYNLSNGGIVYIILSTSENSLLLSTSGTYSVRYKSPNNVYSDIAFLNNIVGYSNIRLVRYKQYYILFTNIGTRVLDLSSPNNSWVALHTVADIPVTLIQTGNEQTVLSGNELTSSYKTEFIVKPDSDDTIYALPANQTAAVKFPTQPTLTYSLANANNYTRERLLHRLNTPAQSDLYTGLTSMVGTTIAIAHSDRVHLSLDGGKTFATIAYPTIGDAKYKNTASLSDDGLCFFYVHSDGVYRYEIGIDKWQLIKVATEPTYQLGSNDYVEIENRIWSISITNSAIGANYCHFINAEKFAFTLAVFTAHGWKSALFTKGLNMTNYFDQDLNVDETLINSYLRRNDSLDYINSISDLGLWIGTNPYLNNRLVRILDNDTVVFYSRASNTAYSGILLKSSKTHVYRIDGGTYSFSQQSINYAFANTHSITSALPFELCHLQLSGNNSYRVLVRREADTYWQPVTYSMTITELVNQELMLDGNLISTGKIYQISSSITNDAIVNIIGITGNSLTVHIINNLYYLSGATLHILNSSNVVINTITLPLITTAHKVLTHNSNFLIYDNANTRWLTNIPMQAVLTYTYTNTSEFTKVPIAHFDDQNLWLGMDNTIWIGNLVNDKLSVLSLNHNTFSRQITAISSLSTTSKAIFFEDSIVLCEQVTLSDDSVAWQYYPLKFTVGVRKGDSVITTNDGKLTLFPTRYGLAALTYQLDIAATEQAITYLSDDIKNLWSDFYLADTNIAMLHHNTQLILSNGTNKILIYDFRTNGWYPLTFPIGVNIGIIQPNINNYEVLELQPANAVQTTLTNLYTFNKERDELYSYKSPYKDLGTMIIPWHLTSQLLLLSAPNNYKNIRQLIVDQVDSHELKQSAYLTTQLFRQRNNLIKPSIELVYDIDTFAKIIKHVNWWKVLGLRWQLENDASSSYPTQLRLYNVSINYDISYEVK